MMTTLAPCHLLAPKEQFACSNRFLEKSAYQWEDKGTFEIHVQLYDPKRIKLYFIWTELSLQGPLQSGRSLLSYRNDPALSISGHIEDEAHHISLTESQSFSPPKSYMEIQWASNGRSQPCQLSLALMRIHWRACLVYWTTWGMLLWRVSGPDKVFK